VAGGFITTLEIEETPLDVKAHPLLLDNWQKVTTPSYFLRTPSNFRRCSHNRKTS